MTGDATGALHGYRAGVAFDGDRQLHGGALVLVEGGVIVGVEPATAAAPWGCAVTAVPDGTLLPGLIDTHVHLCGDDGPRALDQLPELDATALDAIIERALQRQLRAGVTAVRDLGDIGWAVVSRRDRGEGVHIVASGPPITGVGGHCANMGGAVSGRDELVDAIDERAARGADVIKIMASGGLMTTGTDPFRCTFTLDEVRLVVERAHSLGLPVTAHAHALVAVEQVLEAGVDGIEHCSCFTTEGMLTPPELARAIAARGMPVCPTLGRDVDGQIPPRVLALQDRWGLSWQQRLDQVAALQAAGVRLISGSDAGISPAKPHGILPEAVIDLTRIGLPAAEALASTTGRAADALGLGDRTGRLHAGLAADLVLVDGDALTDVSALRAVRTVVVGGREVPPAA